MRSRKTGDRVGAHVRRDASLGRRRPLAVEHRPARLADDERRREALVAAPVCILVGDGVEQRLDGARTELGDRDADGRERRAHVAREWNVT